MSVEERRVKGVEGVARKLGHSVRSGTGSRCSRLETSSSELPQGKDLFIF